MRGREGRDAKRARVRPSLVVTLAALFAAGLAPGPARAGPIVNAFDSGGLFTYSVHTMLPGLPQGTGAVRLGGDTVVHRGRVDTSQIPTTCRGGGTASAEVVDTEIVALNLTGPAESGQRVDVRLRPGMRSTGQTGPFEIAYDCVNGQPRNLRFAQPFLSFFDVWTQITIEGLGTFFNTTPFHVVNPQINGFPDQPDDEGIGPCCGRVQPRPYRHAGAPPDLVGAGIPLTMHADSACHLPFFVPIPAPDHCAGAPGQDPDGRYRTSPINIYVAGVAPEPIARVETMRVDYDPMAFRAVQVTPWADPDANGVHGAMVIWAPGPALPGCGGGGTFSASLTVQAKLTFVRGGTATETQVLPVCNGTPP